MPQAERKQRVCPVAIPSVRTRSRLIVGTAACVAAAWACGLASAKAAGATPGGPAPTAKHSVPGQLGNPLWGVPLGLLSATRERPLFSPSRRPPVVAVVPAPPRPSPQRPAESEQPHLSLVGTVIGSTGSIGIFTDQATKAIVRLRIGEGYAGWILHAIDERAATLERDRRKVTLALPGRNGMAQQGTIIPVLAAPPAVQAQKALPVPSPRVAPSVRPPWMDQGELPRQGASRTALQNPPAAAWLDDDAELVSPPPKEQ